MKHPENTSDFMSRKREELFEAYKRARHNEHFAKSPASRFWVSENRATTIMQRMEKGYEPDDMNPEKREMYLELYRRMKRLQARHPGTSALNAMRIIIYQEAPSFYMAQATADRAIRDMLAERRRRQTRQPKTNGVKTF